MVEITKCPPGVAKGAYDLQNWAHRRSKGQSGVRPDKPKQQTKAQKKRAAARKIRRKKYRVSKRSYRPATTERTDFSDMRVYDQSIPPGVRIRWFWSNGNGTHKGGLQR